MATRAIRLDEAQQVAVDHQGPTLRILAGPGSGKTRVLTARIVRRADEEIDARRVLALTFTRRAAAELRSRIRRAEIRDIGAVGTFHAVALQQLRIYRADHDKSPPIIVSSRFAVLRSLVDGSNAAELVRRADDAIGRGIPVDRIRDSRVAAVVDRYEKHLRRRGLLDFDGVLDECTRLLQTDKRFAQAQRWRFRHIFVDEYQDLNGRQFNLLRAWIGDRDDLCVVGDADQAIYEWNGADARYLRDFEHWFPGAHTVQLTTNHRSSGAIVNAAHAVLGERSVLVRKPEGAVPQVSEHTSTFDEGNELARRLRWRHGEGDNWRDHAVLARTNAQLDTVADVLRRNDIPHQVRGKGGLSRLPAAEQTTELLRTSGDDFSTLLVDLELDEVDSISADQPEVAAIIDLAKDYLSSDVAPSGGGFSQWLRTIRAGDSTDNEDVVDLATFHGSKGLEWPHVTIVGAEEGLFPMNESAEETRLAYVAVTRAERSIHLSWCRTRDGERRKPTRWLSDIEAIGAPDVPATSVQLADHIARARAAALGSDVVERKCRLDRWRNDAAKARRILPQSVLRDDLVEAIARSGPTTQEELLAVTGLSVLRVGRDAAAILMAANTAADEVPTAEVPDTIEPDTDRTATET
ncbi:MAG: ATP-dependent DNA helicase UvrD2 [Actinobacteria bacterium]|nr:ATP-dependent DNA helicase UvrD2 [Actinomycetota bacterium]